MKVRYFVFLLLILVKTANAQSINTEMLESEADVLMEQEKYEEALELYNKILDQYDAENPQGYGALYKRAVCYFRLEHFDKALTDIDFFIEKNPAVPQARLLQTFIYGELDNTDKQLESLTQLVALDPLNTDLVKWQGSLLLQTGQYDEARSKLKWVRNLKNDQEVEMYLGLTYYFTDEADSALIQFDKSLARDRTYIPAYLYAGSLCIQEEAYELALTYLDKALKVENNNLEVLYYKGVALVEMDRKEEGCRYLSKAFYGGNGDASGYLKQYCFQGDF